MSPRKHVLDGDAHWCNRLNTIEPSVFVGSAAFLSDYFDHLLILSTIDAVTESCLACGWKCEAAVPDQLHIPSPRNLLDASSFVFVF